MADASPLTVTVKLDDEDRKLLETTLEALLRSETASAAAWKIDPTPIEEDA